MSILSVSELIERMKPKASGKGQLIITPILDPKLQIGHGGIDLRVGNQFVVVRQSRLATLDPVNSKEISYDIQRYHKRHHLSFGDSFTLHPGPHVLVGLLEYLSLPNDLLGRISLRSSWDRLGLSLASEPVVKPGYRGTITLTVRNNGAVPVELRPCMRFVQLLVQRIDEERSPGTRYDLSTGPEYSKIDQDPELAFLGPAIDRVIVGITGQLGAGKTLIARYLEKQWGFRFYSVSQLVRRAARQRYSGRITHEMMTRVGNELRREFGPGYFARCLLTTIEQDTTSRFIVVDGIFNPAEIQAFWRIPHFYVIAVTSPEEERWEAEKGEWSSREEFEIWDQEVGGGEQPEWGLRIADCIKLVEEKLYGRQPRRAFSVLNSRALGQASLYRQIDEIVATIEWQIGERIL